MFLSRFVAIKRLGVENCGLGTAFLEGLLLREEGRVVDNTMLEELNIASNEDIGDDAGAWLFHFVAIKDLDVEDCNLGTAFLEGFLPERDDRILDNTVLEKLNIAGNEDMDSSAGVRLFHCRALKSLDVSKCALHVDFLGNLLAEQDDNHVMQELILDDNPLGDAAGEPLSRFRRLKSLHVDGCGIGDRFLPRLLSGGGVMRNNAMLEVLIVANNPQIGDASAGPVSHLRSLKHLSVVNTGITDGFFKRLLQGADGHAERFDDKLEELDMAACPQLTDACGRDISRFRGLRSLSAYQCTQLGDAFVENLVGHPNENNTTLRKLNLSLCHLLTDGSARHISRMTALTDLAVRGCVLLGDQFLVQLSTGAENRTLADLNLASCTRLTDACRESIKNFVALTNLQVSYCTSLTDTFLRHLPSSLGCLVAYRCAFSRGEKAALSARVKLLE